MSRKMEEEILKAIGSQAIYYSEVLEQLSGDGAISDYQTQDFEDSLQSLKDNYRSREKSILFIKTWYVTLCQDYEA